MITINNNGQITIQTTKNPTDYPYLMNALLNVCKESVCSPCFDSVMANAVTNVLDLVSEMIPNETQSKAFLEINTTCNYATEIEEIKDSLV